MFSKNDKISKRQVFRLLSYDLLGIGSLLLPSVLSGLNGTYGWCAILIGTAAAALFTLLLSKVADSFGKGESYQDFVKKGFGTWIGTALLAGYGIYYLLMAGYGTYIFGHLIRSNLLKNQSFYWITAVILVLAAYGIVQGIEGRARTYEILFWFLMVPLFIMLFLAARNVDTFNLFPVIPEGMGNIFMGGYLVFAIFSVITFLLFLKPYVSETKKLKQGSYLAVFFAGAVLLVLYEILLGIFGGSGMAAEEYPAVTLMSMVRIPGGFLERQDAFMVAVWFFTVFAFISSSLFYATKITADIIKKKGKKRYILVCVLLVYVIAVLFYRSAQARKIAEIYYFTIGTPFVVLVPIVSAFLYKIRSKSRKQRKK